MLGFLIIVFNIFQSKKRPFPQNGFSLEWSLLSVVLNIIGCLIFSGSHERLFLATPGAARPGGSGVFLVVVYITICSEEFVVDVYLDYF